MKSHRTTILLKPAILATLEEVRQYQGQSLSSLLNIAVASHYKDAYKSVLARMKAEEALTTERTTVASPQIAARYYTQLSPENKHMVDALLHRLGETLEPRMHDKVEHESIMHNGSKFKLGRLVAALTNVPDMEGNEPAQWRKMLGITDETAQRTQAVRQVSPAPVAARNKTDAEIEAELAKPYDLNWGEEATEKVVIVNGEEIDLDDLTFED